jgi:hypothetical protein
MSNGHVENWRDGAPTSPVNAAKSALSKVDRAYALLAQDWCREALKAARKRMPRPPPGFEQ